MQALDQEGYGGEGEDGEKQEGEGEGGTVAVDGPDWVTGLFRTALVWVETGVEMSRHGGGSSWKPFQRSQSFYCKAGQPGRC